jgi:hypothetical protein
MSAHTLTVYSVVLAALLLCSGTWLATRGRAVGYFFALVAVAGFFVTLTKSGAL